MILRFSVPRKPVSVNEAYIRAGWNADRGKGGGKGMILSTVAREFKACVKAYALAATRLQDWPRPDGVKAVRLALTAYNTRHDVDAPIKLTQDALEGIVYPKDTAVREVTARKRSDGGAPRIDVEVELL